METELKRKLIKYLVESYQVAQTTNKNASQLGINYNKINFTFSIEIENEQYLLTRNQLSDTPDGVGDEMFKKIQSWVK